MEYYILPYKPGSVSANLLKEIFNTKMIKREGSVWKPRPSRIVVNWGCGSIPPNLEGANILNQPEAVNNASDKLKAFRLLEEAGVNIPPYTDDFSVAMSWINEGKAVVCRTVLRGHSGEGIVLASAVDDLVEAPLYTQYVPKKSEFRIHCFKNALNYAQKKVRKRDVPDEGVNWKIRNLAGGFVFAHNDIRIPSTALYSQASLAIKALGLDFGAVDILWNELKQQSYVIEVNTSPGLTGESVDQYRQGLFYLGENLFRDVKRASTFEKIDPQLELFREVVAGGWDRYVIDEVVSD